MKMRPPHPLLPAALWSLLFLGAPLLADTATVSLYPDSLRQRIAGISGNLASGSPWGTWPKHIGVLDPVGRYCLNNLKPCPIARVSLPMRQWEPVNDDTNAYNFNWSKLHDTGAVHQFFLDLQELKAKHGVTTLIGSIWTLPDWLDSLEPDRSQVVPMALWPEMLESIASLLIRARDTYGVNLDYVSFNEPDMGIYVLIGSTDLARLIKQAGPRFAGLGLSAKWLGMDGMLYSATHGIYQIAEDVTAMKYVGPFSFHSYRQEEGLYDDNFLKQIASIGQRYNRETWVCETEYRPVWEPEVWPTWAHAWRMANHDFRSLKFAEASALLHWTYNDNFTMVGYNSADSSFTPYPVFYVWKHWTDNLLPGSRVFHSASTDSLVWPLAARNDSLNHFMVHLINRDSLLAKTVKISGIPAGVNTLYRFRTTKGENMALADSFTVSAGSVILTLPPQSVNTLRKGKSPSTSIVTEEPAQKSGLRLTVSPNPCNRSTAIRLTVPLEKGASIAPITLAVFDSRGRVVRTFAQGLARSGHALFTWDGRNHLNQSMPSGVYVLSLKAYGQKTEKRITLLK